MAGTKPMDRTWFVIIEPEEVRLRCSYQRVGKYIDRFTVQLEIRHLDEWQAVVHYDNAHGFCHRDTLHPDGTQEKTALFIGEVNATFTYAIEDLRANWEAHRARYLKELVS